MDNGGRNIHEFDLTPATSGLGDPIKAEVHAVNEWSARARTGGCPELLHLVPRVGNRA
jgi:hypothetical protein